MFGDLIKRKCTKCGEEFMGTSAAKYCSKECHPIRKNHMKKVSKNETADTGVVMVDTPTDKLDISTAKDDIPIVGAEAAISSDTVDISNTSQNATNSIQIIDSSTGAKTKNIFDQIMEVAFNEEFKPITMGLLGGLVAKLQKPNNEVKQGFFIAEDGTEHELI